MISLHALVLLFPKKVCVCNANKEIVSCRGFGVLSHRQPPKLPIRLPNPHKVLANQEINTSNLFLVGY